MTAAFTSDGNHLLVVYADGTAILWNLDPAAWEAQACAVAGRNLSQTEWSELLPSQPYQQLCPVNTRPANDPASTLGNGA